MLFIGMTTELRSKQSTESRWCSIPVFDPMHRKSNLSFVSLENIYIFMYYMLDVFSYMCSKKTDVIESL